MPEFRKKPPPKRILLRGTNWVGDAVMTLPAVRALRQQFPHSYIAVLAMPAVAAVYGREAVDEVILLQGRRGAKDWGKKWQQARQLAAAGYDLGLLFTNSFESAALFRAAGIPERTGYARDGRGWLLTEAVAPPKAGEIPPHESYYYLELLRRAHYGGDVAVTKPEEMTIRLGKSGEARAAGQARLLAAGFSPGTRVVGLSPGAAYGGAKRWLPERFAASAVTLAQQIKGGGSAAAVFGTPDERQLCEEVKRLIEAEGVKVENFAGRTKLDEFIELAAACTVFLTNDSGSMHLASALGVPTVAVFGATNHIGTGPTGAHARVVRHAVDCSPHPHPCLLRECPIDHRCMKAVSAEEVAATALDLLKQ